MMEESKNFRLLSLSETADILCEKKSTLILCHTRPDSDTFGSAMALKLLFSEMGIEARIACDSPLPHRLRFLPALQDCYLYDDVSVTFAPERIISVDTASPAQLGALSELAERVSLMIDHHESGSRYADGYIIPGISSTGEIMLGIAEELCRRGSIKGISRHVASCLYAAISSDTGCFKYSSVSPETHMAAARLLSLGVDGASINHALFDSKPFALLKAEQLGFDNMKLFCGGRVAVILFPYSLKEEHGIEDQYTETLVDVARCVEGVEVAAVIKQPTHNGSFRCSLRSSCHVNVAQICAELGGGGHAKAAGCSIEAESIEKALAILLPLIEKQID